MSDTVRKYTCVADLKNAIVTAIKGQNFTGLGTNVFANRVSKIWPDEETVCIVNVPNVDYEENRTAPRFYIAKGDMFIDVYSRAFVTDYDHTNNAESASALSDFVDGLCGKIVEYLETHVKVGRNQNVNRFFLKATSNNITEGETERVMCRIVYGFEFSIVFNWTAPTDEFLLAENSLRAGDGSGNRVDFDTHLRPGT